jgi:tRNA-Thr(GGU) m(6)t(6)A37 methyltransferase TsaA
LMDIMEFSHIYLFYYFHQSRKTCLHVRPYLSEQEHGIFATRAPHRPNKLGMSLVRLTGIEGNILRIKDIDVLDGTPLLDIKPYIQRFDSRENTRSGWQDTIPDDVASIRGLRDFRAQE